MRSKRTLAAAVAAVALMTGLPGRAASTAPGVHFGTPKAGHPSTYTWTGTVLQAPGSAADVATPTAPKACDAASGLCQDIPLTVPAGLKTSTLYVRIAWRSPVWKAYLYVTSPDGSKVYPSTATAPTATDGDNITDQQGSGLIQHEPIHYTGTDPANPKTLPNQVFSNYVPYFEPMKFNFNYHFLAANNTYTKDLFAAAKAATQLNHDPGAMGVYATSLALPKNYKQIYLTKYNAMFGAFRGSSHVVTDTQTWDLVDAFKVEDWIENSRMSSKYAAAFTDLSSGAKTSAAFINPDPSAQRDPHWNNNGRSAVNVDRTPQGAERGVTFFFMDTFSPSYAAQYFRPDHYHYWGSFNHISAPDTGGGNEIDDARGWGGRYRLYFQDP